MSIECADTTSPVKLTLESITLVGFTYRAVDAYRIVLSPLDKKNPAQDGGYEREEPLTV